MKKTPFLVLFACILLSTLVLADFDEQKAYQWLISKSDNGSFNNNIIDTAIALLALDKAGATEITDKTVNYILSQENVQHCFPTRSCKIKDTALAIIALRQHGEDISKIVEWLENAQSTAALSGTWYLEVITTGSGTCTVEYTNRINQEVKREIEVKEGKFPSCYDSTFLDLNSCLEAGITTIPALTLDVDCTNIDSSSVISLVYRDGNDFYLTDVASGPVHTVALQNGCFGTRFGSFCSYEDSLYAAWALDAAQSNADISFYLKQAYDQNNPLHSSLLYLKNPQAIYLNNLIQKQNKDGSFNRDIYTTSLALLSLSNSQKQEEAQKASDWLKTKQQTDGSLGSVLNTAMALYAMQDISGIAGYCGDGSCNVGETIQSCREDCGPTTPILNCNSNATCDILFGETIQSCPGDCNSTNYFTCNSNATCDILFGETIQSCSDDCNSTNYFTCNNNGTCDDGENYYNCPLDCVCDNNGNCETEYGENYENCPNDCPAPAEICDEDGKCERDKGEDEDNCPQDCIKSDDTLLCGNKKCDAGEEITCPTDCEDHCKNNKWDIDKFEEAIDCGGPCPPCVANCNGDGICELDYYENYIDCPNDCSHGDNKCDAKEKEDGSSPQDCELDTTTPTSEEPTSEPTDKCGNAVCDPEESYDTCPADCEKPSKSKMWIFLLLIIFIAGVIIYYMKFIKPQKQKRKKPQFPTTSYTQTTTKKSGAKPSFTRPIVPRQTQFTKRSSKLDKELEKSLDEAKRLLKK